MTGVTRLLGDRMSANTHSDQQQTVSPGVDDGISTGEDGILVGEDSDIDPTVSVVMPTLNEEDGIRECIPRITEAAAELGMTTEIIVSDSSTDRTPEIAGEMGAIVVEPDETGYGNAYHYGFEHVRGDYVVMGDADTTYDFGELPDLMEVAIERDADIVMGSRLSGEIKPGAMPPLHQYVGNPLLTRFLNTFYDAGVSDAHCGMRVIDADALDALDLESGGMEFASEMIMEAATRDMRIEEVPITYHERVGEATLESFSDGWRHVKFMLTNAPGYLFTLPAILLCLGGTVVAGASLAGLEVGSVTFGMQTLIGGLLFALVGIQVGSLSLFSSVAADPIRKPDDPVTTLIHERFSLEMGATAGIGLFVLSAGFLTYGVLAWSAGAAVPSAMWNLVAATVVVIAVQTVFNSFFLSILAQHTE